MAGEVVRALRRVLLGWGNVLCYLACAAISDPAPGHTFPPALPAGASSARGQTGLFQSLQLASGRKTSKP